ncbi:small-conductance mechanosensitive channel MscS [Morganella psychrotolerans]|uniref:Small-conductance mechanosensitive channel n=1 Tax=Morganella psychrotolerans TaxID=368603 RepID=A0A5M9RCR4_9GAMM|nr:small-conductance mechanosensitive channel MscS [Morganella psychrotolerans]KAA8717876.1 small-conductance mechanosensitive channel MscS [Morganella psychrotolerans]OBU07897.1 mechanosensitive ion channel protein MscS [Morganella psychrotolerans]
MNEQLLTDGLNQATGWLANNQTLLLEYAVNLVAAVLILIIGLFVAKMAGKAVSRLLAIRGVDITVSDFLSAIVRYAMIAFTLIAVLGRLGVQTTSVIAVMGAAGLAIGLALQGSLSNLAAGVLLVVFRPIRAGEYVVIGAAEGTVQTVQIFSTTLRSADDKIIVIPNGKVISGDIINVTREPNRRRDIIVGVAYNADIDLVKKILTDIVEADPRVQQDKGIVVRLNEMAPSSLNFIVRYWTVNGDFLSVNWDLLENFKRALDKHNIGIPFPQLDVHINPNGKQENA